MTSGNGVFACDNVWDEKGLQFYFDPAGIEEVVALDMVSIPERNAYSAIGDYDGFIHTDVNEIPEQYQPNMGSTSAIAYCPQNPDVMIRIAKDQNDTAPGFYTLDGGKTWNKVEDGKIVITEEGKTTIIFRTVNEVGTLSDTTEPFIFKINKETTTVITNNTVDNTIAKKPIPQTGVKNIILVLISVLSISAIIIAIRYWKIK